VRKMFLATTLGLLAVLMLAAPAMAGRTWCARDPIVRVNGHDIQLWVAVPTEYVPLVSGPIDIEILTAKPVDAETLYLDEGFNGYGETVKFGSLRKGKTYSDGSFDIQLNVKVPISDRRIKKVPLQLTFTIGGAAVTSSGDTTVDSADDAMVTMESTTTETSTVTYSGGYTFVVEMDSSNTTLTARFPAS
jgi:hypothetical protein